MVSGSRSSTPLQFTDGELSFEVPQEAVEELPALPARGAKEPRTEPRPAPEVGQVRVTRKEPPLELLDLQADQSSACGREASPALSAQVNRDRRLDRHGRERQDVALAVVGEP